MDRFVPTLGLMALGAFFGCSEEPSTTPSSDAGPAETPKVTVTLEAPTPVAVTWMTAYTTQGNNRMERRLFRGPTDLPTPGMDDDVRLSFSAETADEEGNFGRRYNGWVYGVAELPLVEEARYLALPDRIYGLNSGGIAQPGDVYGRGNRMVPLAGAQASGLVGFRTHAGRGKPRIKVMSSPHEVHLNLADRTFPHLLIGEAEPTWLGVPLLNLRPEALKDLKLMVVENEHFEASSVPFEGIVGGAVTQVPFQLLPKRAWSEAEEEISVRLRVESPSLESHYEVETVLPKIQPSEPYRQTFRSPVDGSVQYYGVRRPLNYDPEASYGMVLSLHGASVEAIGQARAYSPKDWAFIIAATNRRPFGFDWEEWGRLNAMAALDDAVARFSPDPTRMHLTGHSMGGHGTWHNGVMSPGRFATLGPSAGWQSFYTYGGASRPSGPFARSRAHSDTLVYLSNIARRGVYIIHGDADDNVPISEGRTMYELVQEITDDVQMHEEPGAGHWWNGDRSAGADCVDFPPLFEFMQAHTLDPFETDFVFRSPRPGYASDHSYVHLESAISADADLLIESSSDGDAVTLTTTNVRAMRLDTGALRARGVSQLTVDGEVVNLDADSLWLGPENGKTSVQNGPFNQVFHRPFCLIYDAAVPGYASHAAFMSSHWALQGNGSACGLPTDAAEPEGRNPVFIGAPMDRIALPEGFNVAWDDGDLTLAGEAQNKGALQFIAPHGDRLAAALVTTSGHEDLLQGTVPFSSRAGMPDYLGWNGSSATMAGHFNALWQFEP